MVSRVFVLLVCISCWWSAKAFQFSGCRAVGLRRQAYGIRLNYEPDIDTESTKATDSVETREKSDNIFQEILRSLLEAFPWLMVCPLA
jgi:hypothetical protein